MRARNIKPGFFKNEELSECKPLARILFIGLWCMSDRSGRLEDRPRRIKAEILPYDEIDCCALLDELQKKGFILRYTVEENAYIQIVNFTKHQNPHCKEPASTVPAPCLHSTSTVQAVLIPDSLIPDSLIPDSLIPDSLIPDSIENKNLSPSVDGQQDEISTSDELKKQESDEDSYQTRKKRKLKGDQLTMFNEFWDAFDYKVGKAEAADSWIDMKVTIDTFQKILNGARIAARDRPHLIQSGITPKMAQGWLSGKRWDDQAISHQIKPKSKRQTVNEEAGRAFLEGDYQL